MLFWALLAGQINMRKVDRWRTLAKVHHVTAITRVAEDLGEDEDWLRDVAWRHQNPTRQALIDVGAGVSDGGVRRLHHEDLNVCSA